MMELSCRHGIPMTGNPFRMLEKERLEDIMGSLSIENGFVGYYCSVCHVTAEVLRFTGTVELSGNPLV